MNVFIVTWQAGGGAQVALGLGRLLAEHPRTLEFDPGRGRRFEDQPDSMGRIFFGRELVDAFERELAGEEAASHSSS